MEMRVIAEGFGLPEGPLELPGGDILITEVTRGLLTRVTPAGGVSLFATTGGGPNGAALGPDGAIYVAQNGGYRSGPRTMPDGSVWAGAPLEKLPVNGSIQRVSADGHEVTTLYAEVGGHPLVAPNDLVFDSEGNFYFTDHSRTLGRVRELGGVCYASTDGRMIREVLFPLEAANGIALSPDERTLYVAETGSGRVWACALAGPGEVRSRRVLACAPLLPPTYDGSFDSMCVDAESNVLQATVRTGGITVITPAGAVTHHATGDTTTTNCCFGGPELRTLYITLGRTGRLVAVDNWPVVGHRLPFQAAW